MSAFWKFSSNARNCWKGVECIDLTDISWRVTKHSDDVIGIYALEHKANLCIKYKTLDIVILVIYA